MFLTQAEKEEVLLYTLTLKQHRHHGALPLLTPGMWHVTQAGEADCGLKTGVNTHFLNNKATAAALSLQSRSSKKRFWHSCRVSPPLSSNADWLDLLHLLGCMVITLFVPHQGLRTRLSWGSAGSTGTVEVSKEEMKSSYYVTKCRKVHPISEGCCNDLIILSISQCTVMFFIKVASTFFPFIYI